MSDYMMGNVPGITFADTTMPVGSIIPFAGAITKSEHPEDYKTGPIQSWGWLVCDGSPLSVADYPELFAALGYLYGGEDSTFLLPNLEGQFLRGIGRDDASCESRTPAKGGLQNEVGSTQKDALQTHEHLYTMAQESPGAAANAKLAMAVPEQPTGPPETTPGVTPPIPYPVKVSNYESRPTNVFVYYLIKYTYKIYAGQPYV